MSFSINRADLVDAGREMLTLAAGDNDLINLKTEQVTLPQYAQDELNEYREGHPGARVNVETAFFLTVEQPLAGALGAAMGEGRSAAFLSQSEVHAMPDGALKILARKLYDTAAARKRAASVTFPELTEAAVQSFKDAFAADFVQDEIYLLLEDLQEHDVTDDPAVPAAVREILAAKQAKSPEWGWVGLSQVELNGTPVFVVLDLAFIGADVTLLTPTGQAIASADADVDMGGFWWD